MPGGAGMTSPRLSAAVCASESLVAWSADAIRLLTIDWAELVSTPVAEDVRYENHELEACCALPGAGAAPAGDAGMLEGYVPPPPAALNQDAADDLKSAHGDGFGFDGMLGSAGRAGEAEPNGHEGSEGSCDVYEPKYEPTPDGPEPELL